MRFVFDFVLWISLLHSSSEFRSGIYFPDIASAIILLNFSLKLCSGHRFSQSKAKRSKAISLPDFSSGYRFRIFLPDIYRFAKLSKAKPYRFRISLPDIASKIDFPDIAPQSDSKQSKFKQNKTKQRMFFPFLFKLFLSKRKPSN